MSDGDKAGLNLGKSPKPLKILVSAAAWAVAPERFEELRAQGHTVEVQSMNLLGDPTRTHTCPLMDDWDLYLDPKAARFLPGMEKFLDSLIKGARKVRYPGKQDDA